MTTKFTLSDTSWTDLGATPCFIQAFGKDVAFVIDTVAPSALDADHHVLGVRDTSNISLASKNVWARCTKDRLQSPVCAIAIVSR